VVRRHVCFSLLRLVFSLAFLRYMKRASFVPHHTSPTFIPHHWAVVVFPIPLSFLSLLPLPLPLPLGWSLSSLLPPFSWGPIRELFFFCSTWGSRRFKNRLGTPVSWWYAFSAVACLDMGKLVSWFCVLCLKLCGDRLGLVFNLVQGCVSCLPWMLICSVVANLLNSFSIFPLPRILKITLKKGLQTVK